MQNSGPPGRSTRFWRQGVVDRSAEVEANGPTGEVISDVARVRQRAREPVELRHDERVAGAAGGERFAQARAVAAGAGEAVVDVDALRVDAERLEAVALGGESLGVGRDAGVADQQSGHATMCVPFAGPWVLAVIATRLSSRVAEGVVRGA
jgi:hypothetical protein